MDATPKKQIDLSKDYSTIASSPAKKTPTKSPTLGKRVAPSPFGDGEKTMLQLDEIKSIYEDDPFLEGGYQYMYEKQVLLQIHEMNEEAKLANALEDKVTIKIAIKPQDGTGWITESDVNEAQHRKWYPHVRVFHDEYEASPIHTVDDTHYYDRLLTFMLSHLAKRQEAVKPSSYNESGEKQPSPPPKCTAKELPSDAQPLDSIRISMSSSTRSLFSYDYELNLTDYTNFCECTNLQQVSFSQFPYLLMRMFNTIKRAPSRYFLLFFQMRSSAGPSSLNIVENQSDKKFVEFLSLPFVETPRSQLEARLSFALTQMRKRYTLTSERLHELTMLVSKKHPTLIYQLLKATKDHQPQHYGRS
mmetsp:Transcript_5000/g.7417  ORF Transcript_5000/g.7417 Transcript_5000/m.7417 type:complete len:360 (-) Transcript_5000:29-1108(-)